jgi:hypothetical protein
MGVHPTGEKELARFIAPAFVAAANEAVVVPFDAQIATNVPKIQRSIPAISDLW